MTKREVEAERRKRRGGLDHHLTRPDKPKPMALQRLTAKSGGSAYVFLNVDRLAQISAYMAGNDGKLSANDKLVRHFEKSWDALQGKAAARLSKGQPEPYRGMGTANPARPTACLRLPDGIPRPDPCVESTAGSQQHPYHRAARPGRRQ